tara:strand:+ start:486 stop:860 length:375 start_codon:yes stop_codon:yes gene_type:complete
MAQVRITIPQISGYCEAKVQELVREASVVLRNKLIDYSPTGEVNGGTFISNWQPPVYADKGLTARIVNNTQNYGEAITFGKNMPPSWDGFRSRFGLMAGWPEKLAGKDTRNEIPGLWASIVRRG